MDYIVKWFHARYFFYIRDYNPFGGNLIPYLFFIFIRLNKTVKWFSRFFHEIDAEKNVQIVSWPTADIKILAPIKNGYSF